MTTDDWRLVETAFQDVVDLQGDARDDFLRDFERKHPDLIGRLNDLLSADARDDAGIEKPIESSVRTLAKDAIDPWIGRTVDVWNIRRRIATGGMGAVFDAERSDGQFEQRVAIKLMNAQLLAPDALQRFRAERQILADLNHPYIGQLIDGGTTEDGVPYLVMEYVEGLPIDEHCEHHRLGVDERLALFRQVCDAVDYAHRRLTVHRDLKPSNILIDSHGNPKLLDFGIAKLLDARMANVTMAVTREGSRAMTPEYASPEQVRGEPVSVATDVYSLGVLLYRLMTGQSPYGTTVKTPVDYERAIVEQDPLRPSTVVTRTPGATVTGRHGGLSAKDLRHRLMGDLDNIALKTLQKDPERRYLSASALAADIGRYLRHEPIEARGDDWLYKSRKFARRHSRGLAIAALVTVGIAALTTFYTLRLADERDRAQLAASEAEQVAGFLTTMLESASPHTADGESITAIDLLNSGVENIDALGDQPLLQSRLYRIMGSSFHELGEYERSRVVLEKSVALLDDIPDVDPVLVARSRFVLAEAQRLLEMHDDSIANRRLSLALMEEHLGEDHPDTIYARVRLGTSLSTAGRGEEALRHLRVAREASERIGSGFTPVTLDAMGVGAVVLSNLGQYREAQLLNAEAIKHSKVVLGEMDPNTVVRIRNSGVYLREQFLFEDALAHQTDANERGKSVWPSNSPFQTYGLYQEAITLQHLGRFDEAWRRLEAAREYTVDGPGNDSLEYAFDLATRAGWYFDQARYREALDEFRRGHDVAVAARGMDTRRAVEASIGVGRSLAAIGDLEEAESVLRDAVSRAGVIRVHTKLIGENALAGVLSRRGAYEEADRLFAAILDEKTSHVGADSAALAPFLVNFAAHERRKGNFAQAAEAAKRAHESTSATLPAGNWIAALATAEYARALDGSGRSSEAEPLFRRAHGDLLAVFGENDPRVRELADKGLPP